MKNTNTTKSRSIQQAIEGLKKNYLKFGSIIYTILRHVGRLSMMRYLDIYVVKDNEPLRITWDVAKVIEASYNRNASPRDGVRHGTLRDRTLVMGAL